MLIYLLGLSILPFSNPHLLFPHFKRIFHSIISPPPAPICICPSPFTPFQAYQQFDPNIFPKTTFRGDLDIPVTKTTTESNGDIIRGDIRENIPVTTTTTEIHKDIMGGKDIRENVEKKETVPKKAKVDPVKAETCSKMECATGSYGGPVCACNHITGHVASFGNSCDLKKHNCRFDTDFNLILEQVCPWEFQSRRSNSNKTINFDYSDPKYYN